MGEVGVRTRDEMRSVRMSQILVVILQNVMWTAEDLGSFSPYLTVVCMSVTR